MNREIGDNIHEITKNTDTSIPTKSSTENSKNTVYVSTNGKDTNSGTLSYPKATIKNAFENVANGGTIYLGSGTYTEYGINLNKNVNIIGNGTKTTIINSKKKHTFTVNANVLLKAFTITDAHEKNNGGAIYNKGTLTMEGIKIQSSSASNSGGAIYNKGTLKATKSAFCSNNAQTGGAIYNRGSLSLNRCTFDKNTAAMGSSLYSTGKITVNGCNYTNNINSAIYIQNKNSNTIRVSSFISNTGNNGGAINSINSTLTLEKTYFENNIAKNNGGALYSTGNTILNICTFTKNSANNGGAVVSSSGLTVTNSSIKYNKANNHGGAIYNKNSKITIANTKFNSNSANNGGAISTTSNSIVKLSIENSEFNNNNATAGGAIFAYNKTQLDIKNSFFNNNKGSAVYVKTSAQNNLIYSSRFTKNSGTYGGAVRNYYSTLIMNRNYISANSATYGGAIFSSKALSTLTYNIIINNGGNDIYNNPGTVTANYNWWGSDDKVASNRIHKTTVNNWLYMTLSTDNNAKVNERVNAVVSLYNVYNGSTLTSITNKNLLCDINMNIKVNGCGITNTRDTTNQGYYSFTTNFTKEGTASITAKISSQLLTKNIKISNELLPGKITSVFVRIGYAVTSYDVQKWIRSDITDVYIETSAAHNKTENLRNVIKLCKNTKIRVHAWVICLKNENGFDISATRQNLVKNFVNYTMRINGISGICLDYIRYSGTKANVDSTKITNFVKSVHNIIKSYNKNLIVSGTVFPEKEGTLTYYGQDYAALSPYLDVMMPMAYKYDYKEGTAWLKSVTSYVVKRAVYSKVVTVLQTYKTSGGTSTELSKSELENDARAVMSVGSYGYSLFRYGLISSYPTASPKL